jgi:hypothetical protein
MAEIPLGNGALSLEVLVLYEDFGTGLRAKHTFDGTMQRLAFDADVHVKLWRFDLLGEPALYDQAASEASEADIVFVSAHGQGELPVSVTWWLQQWLVRKGGEPCALAVSLDAGAGETPTAAEMLRAVRGIAERAGVELFCTPLRRPKRNANQTSRTSIGTQKPGTRLPPAEPYLYRGWGINE